MIFNSIIKKSTSSRNFFSFVNSSLWYNKKIIGVQHVALRKAYPCPGVFVRNKSRRKSTSRTMIMIRSPNMLFSIHRNKTNIKNAYIGTGIKRAKNREMQKNSCWKFLAAQIYRGSFTSVEIIFRKSSRLMRPSWSTSPVSSKIFMSSSVI